MTGALSAPRPPGCGCGQALTHAGIMSVEGGEFPEAAMLLQEVSGDKIKCNEVEVRKQALLPVLKEITTLNYFIYFCKQPFL